MKAKYYIYLSLISIFLCLGLSVLGGYGGHGIKFLVVSIVYCGLTYFLLFRASNKTERILSVLILFLPPFLIYGLLNVIDFEISTLSLPSTLAHFIGIGFGIVIYVSRLYLKIALALLLVSGSIWMAFTGYSCWIHKLNFGTFTGMVSYKAPAPVEGFDQYNNYISENDLEGKIVLLDFWFTGCGLCFGEFPEIQKLYDKYKNDPSISILAINKPVKNDSTGQAYAMIKERNYTFPTVVPANINLPELFGVEFYPTVIILDKEGTAVFRGSVDKAEKIIQGLIKSDN